MNEAGFPSGGSRLTNKGQAMKGPGAASVRMVCGACDKVRICDGIMALQRSLPSSSVPLSPYSVKFLN